MSATSKNCSLLFVHGWATDSSVWKYQVKEFSKDYEIVTIDLQGHCEKDIWPEPSLKPAVEKILQLTAHSSQRTDFIGIGWSLGGQALLETAVKNPDLFKSLVLIGTAPKFVADETFPYGQPQGVAKRMLKDIKKDFFKTMKRFYPLNFTKEELAGSDAEWFLGYYCEKRCAAFHHDSIAKSLGALLSFDIRKNLNGIKVPVLIIHGEKDNVCPVDTGKYLAENLPNARLEIFKDAGHAPFLTRYKEFNEAVQRFVEGISQ